MFNQYEGSRKPYEDPNQSYPQYVAPGAAEEVLSRRTFKIEWFDDNRVVNVFTEIYLTKDMVKQITFMSDWALFGL